MKHIQNFIVEKLHLSNNSTLHTKLTKEENIFKGIIDNFKQLQKDKQLNSFYNKFDWNRINQFDLKEISSDELKRIFYARANKEESERTFVIYKNENNEFNIGSIGKYLFKTDLFIKDGPAPLDYYGPSINNDNSTKEKYKFIKNRKAYMVVLPLK